MFALIEIPVEVATDQPAREQAADRRPPADIPEPPDDRPRSFLEALRRMLASIHT